MADFKLMNTKRPFIIRDENDDIVFSKNVNVGDNALISSFQNMVKKVEKIQAEGSDSMIDEIIKIEKDLIKLAFPIGHEKLYELADDNIMIYNQIISELTGMIK